MSVLLETSLGEIVVDLDQDCTKSATNFIKLCKAKHYNFSYFTVIKGFTCQISTTAPSSVWGLVHGNKMRYFQPEIHPKLKHKKGTVAFSTQLIDGKIGASSSFYISLSETESLDGKHGIFGCVAEGFDVLDKINETLCDDKNRPFIDIRQKIINYRILHTIILDDPYPDPKGLVFPENSPLPTAQQLEDARLPDDDEGVEMTEEEREIKRQREETAARALTLEMVGDLPFAEIKPPENILFVCKLNPITRDKDLELIFSRFGKILSCEIIRDPKTLESLGYAFIEFENQTDCEEAYFKMENVLIDGI